MLLTWAERVEMGTQLVIEKCKFLSNVDLDFDYRQQVASEISSRQVGGTSPWDKRPELPPLLKLSFAYSL